MTDETQEMLEERGKRYGPFSGHSRITQAIKASMNGQARVGNSRLDSESIPTNWNMLNPSQKEALEMIAHKIGRILNGDPNYADSWQDIAGYAQLVVNQLNGKDT